MKKRGKTTAERRGFLFFNVKVLVIVLSFIAVVCGAGVISAVIYPYRYGAEIKKHAEKYALNAALVCAVIRAESRFDPERVSGAGAAGLMQLMPSTALYIAEKDGMEDFDFSMLYVPDANIRLGCAYLRYLFGRFGDERTAVAAYNAGEGAVRMWLNDKAYSADGKTLAEIPYAETREYVAKVFSAVKIYSILTRIL